MGTERLYHAPRREGAECLRVLQTQLQIPTASDVNKWMQVMTTEKSSTNVHHENCSQTVSAAGLVLNQWPLLTWNWNYARVGKVVLRSACRTYGMAHSPTGPENLKLFYYSGRGRQQLQHSPFPLVSDESGSRILRLLSLVYTPRDSF
eukprot:4263523-Amphidinium_carterae.2